MEDVSKIFGKFERGKVVHFGCENKYLKLTIPSEAKIDSLVVYKSKQALAELGARVSPLAETTAAGAERKLPDVRVDKERLIGSEDKMAMEWLATAAKMLSLCQQRGGLSESVKRAGEEREAFIKSMRSLREKVYHLKPELQRKVLLAALGEEEPGTSLTEQFDREFDGLLLSWGVDFLK